MGERCQVGTTVAAALLDGEAEDLVRKAVELAKAGDVVMLKFLLGRILPRERPIKLELPPMEFADDAVEAHGFVTGAVAAGTISPSEGAALATLMNSYARAIDMADVRKEAGCAGGPTKRGARTMSQARFRRIARLEKLAHPYLEGRRHAEQEWKSTLRGAVANAAILAFLVRYGNPIIDEPLSCACQRCGESSVWRELADKFPAALLNSRRQYTFEPHNRDGAGIIGAPLRRLVISLFPGADEKEKLDAVFASAPPWLIWFTFGD